MDFVLTAALQEIALEGLEGCTLQKLWTMVLAAGVDSELITNTRMKQFLWLELLKIPGMVLLLENSESVSKNRSDIQCVNAAESLGLRLIASESLRESALGMYDLRVCDARLSKEQRSVLECIAKSRTNGITQSQLSKEFKIPGNKMFYLVKMLEVRGLVVRQATLVRNLQGAADGSKGIVATNLLHLTRYAKDTEMPSCHQRFDSFSTKDVSRTDREVEGAGQESGKTEFIIKDDIPAMEAVCQKLEETDGKVLVVSDIKASLGYRMAVGHRTWRRIVKRLQDAGLVEILNAQVEKKVGRVVFPLQNLRAGDKLRFDHYCTKQMALVFLPQSYPTTIIQKNFHSQVRTCIRLVRPFDKRAFKTASGEGEAELPLKCAKRGQVTDLVAELSIDQQIYDLVDRSGPEGVQMIEVFNSLGLQNKRNYYRISTMLDRQILVSEAENHKRSTLYRLKTQKNLNSHPMSGPRSEQSAEACGQDTAVVPVNSGTNDNLEDIRPSEQLDSISQSGTQRKGRGNARQALQEARSLKGQGKNVDVEGDTATPEDPSEADETLDSPLIGKDALVPFVGPNQRTSLLHTEAGVQVSLTTSELKAPHPPRNTPLSTTRAQRERRILEKLQIEKFILRVELHRWLEEQENRKNMMMDRKTLSRMLQGLQASGDCKCIMLSMPGLTNCGRQRTTEVVLHPSVSIDPEFLSKVHDQVRKFDMISRGHGVSRVRKAKGAVPVLTGVPRMMPDSLKRVAKSNEKPNEAGRSMQSGGFIPAKMIRVRMLHHFLWRFVNSLWDYGEELPNDLVSGGGMVGSCRMFALANAVQAMPLELFVQTVGSMHPLEHGAQWCRQGLRLRDLPDEDRLALLDSNATGRLSWLVDVLRRLKLVRLVMGGETAAQLGHGGLATPSLSAVLTYAMEREPYLEEPASHPLHSMKLDTSDTAPRARHEFSIGTKDGLDDYWQNLEYFYSGAQPTVARHSFPGSSVPELFGLRSWASVKVMTVEQRTELLKRVGDGGLEKRKPWQECVVIAKELNLSLQQVLRVSYEKNRAFRLQNLRKSGQSPKKRGNMAEEIAEPPHVKAYKRQKARADKPSTSESGRQDAGNMSDHPGSADEADSENEDNVDFNDGGEALSSFSFPGNAKPFFAKARRFTWSEELDRKLMSVYAIRRGQLGALFQRVDWESLPDLPAHPKACRRRMGYLRMDPGVRKALSSLCSLLSIRYTKHTEGLAKRGTPDNDPHNRAHRSDLVPSTDVRRTGVELDRLPVNRQSGNQTRPNSLKEGAPESEGSQDYDWNDFREPFLAAAMDEVMRCKTALKANAGLRGSTSIRKQGTLSPISLIGFDTQDTSKVDITLPGEPNADTDAEAPDPPLSRLTSNLDEEDVPGAPLVSEEAIAQLSSLAPGRPLAATGPTRRLRKSAPTSIQRHLRKVSRVPNEQQIRDSVPLANAVELVKVVLLNSGVETPVATSLVDAVGRFRETDIFSAVKYLRDCGFLVLGSGGQTFVLSSKFLHDYSASRFPMETSHECSTITEWFSDHSKELEGDWVTLPSEPGSGELSHLLALVSTDNILLNPELPPKDIGETVAKMKRKSRLYEQNDPDASNPKVMKAEQKLPKGLASRRERGFAGIEVKVTQGRRTVASTMSTFQVESDDASGPPFNRLPMTDLREQFDQDLNEPEASDLRDEGDGSDTGESKRTVDRIGGSDKREVALGASISHHRSLSGAEGESGDGSADDHFGNVNTTLADCIRHRCSQSRHILTGEKQHHITSENLQSVYNAIEEAGVDGAPLDILASKVHTSEAHGEDHHGTAETVVKALESFGLVKQVNGYDNVRVFLSSFCSCFFLQVPNQTNAESLQLVTGDDLSSQSGMQKFQTSEKVSDMDPGGAGKVVDLSAHLMNASSTLTSEQDSKSRDHRIISLRQEKTLDDSNEYIPIMPWLDAKGNINKLVLKGFVRRVMGVIALHPGISEDLLVEEVNVLNPQSVRQLLQLLVLDDNIMVRSFSEPVGEAPPNLLQGIIGSSSTTQRRATWVKRHFVNPLAGSLL